MPGLTLDQVREVLPPLDELRPILEASDFPKDIFPPEARAAEEKLREEMEKSARS